MAPLPTNRLSYFFLAASLAAGVLLVAPLRSQETPPPEPLTPQVGDQIELRCVGPNGVFDHPALGDDFIAIVPFDVAAQPESIEAAGTILTAFYKYFGISPINQTCRFYRVAPPETEPAGG